MGKSHEHEFCRRENRTVKNLFFKCSYSSQGNHILKPGKYTLKPPMDYHLHLPVRKNLGSLDTKDSIGHEAKLRA